jgi:hypothetical protein
MAIDEMVYEINLILCAAHEAAHAIIGHVQGNPIGGDGVCVDEFGIGNTSLSSRIYSKDVLGVSAYGIGKKLTFRMLCMELTELMAGGVVESILYGVKPYTYQDVMEQYEDYKAALSFGENPEYGDTVRTAERLSWWHEIFPQARPERIYNLCMARTFRLVDSLLDPIEQLTNILLDEYIVSPEDCFTMLEEAGVEMHISYYRERYHIKKTN